MAVRDEEFRALYDAHAPAIRRYVARIVGDADAEDVTQEAFARAHRALATHRGESRVSTWLYRIATNAAVDRLRSASSRETAAGAVTGDPEPGELLAEAATCGAEADGRVIRKEMSHCILGLVGRLAPAHREVILLGELRELSDREIADALAGSGQDVAMPASLPLLYGELASWFHLLTPASWAAAPRCSSSGAAAGTTRRISRPTSAARSRISRPRCSSGAVSSTPSASTSWETCGPSASGGASTRSSSTTR